MNIKWYHWFILFILLMIDKAFLEEPAKNAGRAFGLVIKNFLGW